MKRRLFFLACVLSVVCFSTSAGAGGKGTVFYLSPNQFDEFQTTASKLIAKYVKDAGYECKELVAGSEDVALQLNQLDNVITQKPKAIIMAPVDPIAIVDGVEKARAAGIPVIAFDRTITQTKVDFTSVAGCYKMGVLSAGEMARLLKEKYGEVKGTVLDILAEPTDSYAILIEEGIQDTMKKYPNVKIETKVAGHWDANKAASIADDYLVVKPDTDLIFTSGDFLAAAVVSVLQTKGLKKGQIIMVTTCGMPQALNLIRDGWIQSDVEQPLVAQAQGVAMFLDDIISKKRIEPGEYMVGGFKSKIVEQRYGLELQVPGTPITSKNVDDPKFWGNQVGK